MTKNRWLWLFAALFLPVVVALAQTTPGTALPNTVSQYWDLAITGLTPLVVFGVYKLVPKIPKWVLPASTPFIGILLGLAVDKLTSANLAWVDMAKAGALAVFIREVINQAVTKQMVAPDSTPTTSPPAPPAPPATT